MLVLAVAPAWPFAAVQAAWEFVVCVAVAVLLALWAAHAVVTRQFHVRADAVAVALAGLILWSVVQLVPLPLGVVRVISPGAAAVHETFRPEVRETLPGEGAGAPRPGVLPLSVEPDATRTFAVRLTAVLLVYAAARNWLAGPASFHRLAWAATANGLALAVLALAQFVSSPRDTAFWSIPVGRDVFGPFVNRNHFSDFLAGCVGLGVGLTLTLRTERAAVYRPKMGNEQPILDRLLAPFRYLDQPWPLAAAAAVAVMAASVLFSLSRGGVLALAVAGVGCALLARRRSAGAPAGVGGWAIGLAAVVAVGLAGWFGWEPVRARFATLLTVKNADDRTALWRDAARAADGFWAVGSGHGTFIRVETLGRRDGPSSITNDHAHNEYLEAAVEGGVVRVALTLLLVGGALVGVGRGFVRQRGGPPGTLLLGAWFGLAALAAHALTDFGVHLPAVAVFAAILAGFAMGVSDDPEAARVRKKVRVRVRKSASPPPLVAAPAPVESPSPPVNEGGGLAAVAGAVMLALAGLAIAGDAWTRSRSEALLDAAWAFRDPTAPDQQAARVAVLTARTRVRPDDPAVWLDLAQAHIDSGSPADVRAALAALRTARDRCPVYPEVQFRLGLFARSFEKGDPPLAYFERAKRLLVMDADVWFASGMESLRTGDEAGAWTGFRQSLALSGKRSKAIIAEAGKRLPPDRLAALVLLDDPVMLLAAADQLYPDPAKQAALRRPLLERAAAAPPSATTPEPLLAAARALGELGRGAEAEAVWRRVVALAPERIEYRDLFARWLEDEERYAVAVVELEWLTDRRPDDKAFRDRLLVARHAARLQADIGE
jgi:O-antigen ligase/tetratricopeptide (TPR) repeat protein